MSKTPSPCIKVCKFRRGGHCIGCSMTKDQKSLFKSIRKEKRRLAFLQMLLAQQRLMGGYTHWRTAYQKRWGKKKPPAKTTDLLQASLR